MPTVTYYLTDEQHDKLQLIMRGDKWNDGGSILNMLNWWVGHNNDNWKPLGFVEVQDFHHAFVMGGIEISFLHLVEPELAVRIFENVKQGDYVLHLHGVDDISAYKTFPNQKKLLDYAYKYIGGKGFGRKLLVVDDSWEYVN